MAEYLPFINTEKDCRLVASIYSDAEVARVSLESSVTILSQMPKHTKLWVDAGVDGLGRWPIDGGYLDFAKKYTGFGHIGNPESQRKPIKATVELFVNGILDDCLALSPSWISVPQLPAASDASRNKVNRLLAEAAGQWAKNSGFRGKLILPIIFTHQDQVNSKTSRNPHIKLAAECYEKSRANGYWTVESSLNDQDGSRTLEHKRFPGLVALHEELKAVMPSDAISVGGPYWGMNLVLWTRGLVKYPAIGLGNAYQYHIPGGIMMPGKSRLAIPPLRRLAVARPQLKDWIRLAAKKTPSQDSAHAEFQSLERDFDKLATHGRSQIAKFYHQWFSKIAESPLPGRAVALYQDLSTAYVLGKTLPDLPSDEGTARKADRVAKQLMLSCL